LETAECEKMPLIRGYMHVLPFSVRPTIAVIIFLALYSNAYYFSDIIRIFYTICV